MCIMSLEISIHTYPPKTIENDDAGPSVLDLDHSGELHFDDVEQDLH